MTQGERLREVRRFLGYRTDEIGVAVGRPKKWVESVERLEDPVPVGDVRILCDCYGVDLREFFDFGILPWMLCRRTTRFKPLPLEDTPDNRDAKERALALPTLGERLVALCELYDMSLERLAKRSRIAVYRLDAAERGHDERLEERDVQRLNILFGLCAGKRDLRGRKPDSHPLGDLQGVAPLILVARGLNLVERMLMDPMTTPEVREEVMRGVVLATEGKGGNADEGS